jgi:prophage antirepressor-like protein
MSNIITHNFAGMDTTFPVRIVELDGQPWFVATDIRQVLGITQGGTNFKHLGADEVRRIPSGLITGKGMSTASLISESGLYKLIMRSDKPQARLFQDWVTRDVLPAIRKDGAYIMGEEKVASGEMSEDEFVLKAMRCLSSPATTTAPPSPSALTATST